MMNNLYALVVLVLVLTSPSALAARAGDYEYSVFVPFLLEETVDFEGGATATLETDPGFGFSVGYNTSENVTARFDLSWNSVKYSATRVLDDGLGGRDRISGNLDSFNMGVGGDYYFTNGKVAPYVSGNLGWSYIDSNIPTGDYTSICWWDPWWGYICSNSRITYTSSKFYYGLGAGVRINLTRSNFIRLGYYENFRDFSNASGTPRFGSVRVEFGVSY